MRVRAFIPNNGESYIQEENTEPRAAQPRRARPEALLPRPCLYRKAIRTNQRPARTAAWRQIFNTKS